MSNYPYPTLENQTILFGEGGQWGECFPFWKNGVGGFKEHKQINWTNLFLIKRFGMPTQNGQLVGIDPEVERSVQCISPPFNYYPPVGPVNPPVTFEGCSCTEIQTKLNNQTIEIKQIIEQDRQSCRNDTTEILKKLKELDKTEELKSEVDKLFQNQTRMINRLDEINNERIRGIQSNIDKILKELKGGDKSDISDLEEKLQDLVDQVKDNDNRNYKNLKKEIESGFKKNSNQKDILEIKGLIRNLDQKEVDLQPVLENQQEILNKLDNQKIDLSPLENQLGKIEKEVIKGNKEIEKIDTTTLEKQLVEAHKGLKESSEKLDITNARLTDISQRI